MRSCSPGAARASRSSGPRARPRSAVSRAGPGTRRMAAPAVPPRCVLSGPRETTHAGRSVSAAPSELDPRDGAAGAVGNPRGAGADTHGHGRLAHLDRCPGEPPGRRVQPLDYAAFSVGDKDPRLVARQSTRRPADPCTPEDLVPTYVDTHDRPVTVCDPQHLVGDRQGGGPRT